MKKKTMYAALILALIIMAAVDLYNMKNKPKSNIVKEPSIIVKDTVPDFGIISKGTIVYDLTYNICIGKGAGTYLINERLCVIVGHSKKHIEAKGKDMIWMVDWNEPYLKNNPDIKAKLKQYYNEVILKGRDCEELRKDLWHRIAGYENIAIGADALIDTTKYSYSPL